MKKIRKLNCRKVNIEPDPKMVGRKIVSIKFDDGESQPYIKAFSVIPPEAPISVEQFVEFIKEQDLSRPVDPFKYLEEAKENEEPFEVAVEA